jgi:hypothetical protein
VTTATSLTIGVRSGNVTKTGQVSVAPAGFQPKSVTAGELTMTGQRQE